MERAYIFQLSVLSVVCVPDCKGGNPMGSTRKYSRIYCDSSCIMNYEGFNYQALLDNISLGGALVSRVLSDDILFEL
jgi:hypothetical protein